VIGNQQQTVFPRVFLYRGKMGLADPAAKATQSPPFRGALDIRKNDIRLPRHSQHRL